MSQFVISLLMILSHVSLKSADEYPLVQLPNGIIRGRKDLTTTGQPFWAFQKIPYAAPPIGELRFQPPVPPKNWDGILDTVKNDVVCYQVPSDSELESEDCLYLNVYTTKFDGNPNDGLLPVMFYIHGGGFIEGNSLDHIYGPEFLLDRDVVVVTINYRLGPFGFLSTQDLVIPGNNGLKDQLLALQWTQSNIQLFGGDSDKITIFGQDAGSASVTYHLLHTKSDGLFRAAICQSGSFLCPWAYQRNAREYAFQTAGYILKTFINSNDSQELFEYLIHVKAEELDNASYQLSLTENLQNQQLFQGYFYAPVIELEHEGAFLTQKMYEQLRNGDFIKVPTLMGFNSEENAFFAYLLNWLGLVMEDYDNNLDWLVPNDMNVDDFKVKRQIGAEIREIYTDGIPLYEAAEPSVRYCSDNSYTRPIRKHAELQSQFIDVYFYQFSYDGNLGNFSFTFNGLDNVTHGEDNKYIWRMYDEYYDNSQLNIFPLPDKITQTRIQKIWTDFAKYLHPTPNRSEILGNLEWPKFSTNFAYVDILNDLFIKSAPKNETYVKWLDIYDSLEIDNFDTY